MSITTGIRKDKNPTVSALFGVAAIQAVLGFLGWSTYRENFGWLDWVIVFSGGIYIVLGVAARWVRLTASLIGAGFYAAFLVVQAFRSADLLVSGLIFKIPVVALLFAAVGFALRRPVATSALSTGEERP